MMVHLALDFTKAARLFINCIGCYDLDFMSIRGWLKAKDIILFQIGNMGAGVYRKHLMCLIVLRSITHIGVKETIMNPVVECFRMISQNIIHSLYLILKSQLWKLCMCLYSFNIIYVKYFLYKSTRIWECYFAR